MNTQVRDYLAGVSIAEAQEFKNLVMIPIISRYEDGFNYILLDEALEQRSVVVSEIDRQGSVPDLQVINRSGKMVLIFDGEELVGAKQNRIVNTTILLAPESETKIPVSCVEQGRWSHRSDHFYSEKRMSPSAMRRSKSEQVHECLSDGVGFRSNQGRIWSEIRERQARRAAFSPTGEMSELYRKDRPVLDEYLEKFRPVAKQVGALFAINERIAGLDSYGSPEIMQKVFGKLVESYAIDALDMYRGEAANSENGLDAEHYLRQCRDLECREHSSVALGIDCRLTSNDRIGAALVYENRLLHLSVFARETMQGRGNNFSRSHFSRMSRRRRFRFDD